MHGLWGGFGRVLGGGLLGLLVLSAAGPSAAASEADVTALSAGNTAFAVDLYQTQCKQPGNLFCSPYSVSVALAMTYGGARGTTAEQMAKALRFTLPPERLHPAFRELADTLTSRAKLPADQAGTGFQLNVANALWGQRGMEFLPAYLSLMEQEYRGGLRQVDFATAAEPARKTINGWVADQTKQRILDLVPAGQITPDTRLVLTNAIYFLASWAAPFSARATTDAPFTLVDGKTVTVPMMHRTGAMGYAQGEGWQAVALPYVGEQLAMVAIVPEAGSWPAFEEKLSAAQFGQCLTSLRKRPVRLAMPRFQATSAMELRSALSSLGMPIAFGGGADLSGMTGTRELSISAVLHKAFVKVNEEGTEAAAATAVVMGKTAIPTDLPKVSLDRPFLFAIVDRPTGAVLFMGRVMNPVG